MMSRSVVRTGEQEWECGRDVVKSMVPEFRDNLGPAERVSELYELYWQKTLRSDPVTKARADLIHLQPGYEDLTLAYHDSVEEALVLSGSFHLDGEGDFAEGDYFWRPPGWVHAARTEEGFQALLLLTGDAPGEGSGPTSRHVRPPSEAGTNVLHPDDRSAALGPRGWVRCLHHELLAWQPGSLFARDQGALVDFDLDGCSYKVLSSNPFTGGQSLLVQLEPGYEQRGPGRHSGEWQWYVVRGDCALGDEPLPTGAYVLSPPGTVDPPLRSTDGALLFWKTSSWLDRLPA